MRALAGVRKRYSLGGPWVLDGIELELGPGGLVRIVGGNGTGKSTLLRLIAGIGRPTRGRVTGRPVTGYVPERFPPGLPFTALDYLTHLGRVHGLTTAAARGGAAELLDELGAAGFARTPLRELSKGTAQKVAVGSPVYSAAPGEKWIDVNLSNHTITAYEGATVVRGPIAMVNGAKATPTVVGTFHIYSKVRTQTMRGDNADGTRYETPNVPWVSYFYSGYALHGAPWRSSFGYTGSHGCINLPVPVAEWVFAWAPVGTTVVAHR